MTGGDSIQRYQLGEPLGQGGQGRTFRAVDSVTGKAVAVKRIRLRGAESWKPFDLFERECQVLRALDHPGIPNYLDTFAREEQGEFYLVMELVEGTTLAQLLKTRQVLSEAQLWNILHQALQILQYLHGRHPPVIHRDIKPANLIQRPDNSLALVDFGGVRVALRPEGGSTVVGSFGYMAPEQLHGEATPATDIYGLGATLASMASGIEADRLPRKGLKIDLEQVMPPSALRDLLLRMLEPDPSHRLASAGAVRQAIERGAGTPAGDTPAGEAAPDTTDSPLHDVGPPLSFIIRILGSVGYVGLVVIEAVLLPLIFVMLGAAWSKDPNKIKRLREGQRRTRQVVGSGRRSMRALAQGKNPYRPPKALPPRSRRRRGGRHRHR